MSIKVVNQPEPKPGSLKLGDLYSLSVGQVIGAGVITLVVPAIHMTGYSAWLAYAAAILMGFIMISPMIYVTSTLRLGGGNYSLIADMSGGQATGIFAYFNLMQAFSIALFGVAASNYVGDVFPALSSPIAQKIVAVTLLTFFYVVNMRGINVMARVQNLLTIFLILALIVFAVVGITNIKNPIFATSDPNFLTNGWTFTFDNNGQISGGFLGAVLLFVYSTNGYYMTSAYGRDAKNAKRDIPKAILLTVPTLIILYVGVSMAAAGVLSIEEYGDSTTLVFAAQEIFPHWVYVLFIIGGPIGALLSTLNSSFANFSIQIGQSADDGWFPEKFGENNGRGARKFVLTYIYIASMLPVLLGLTVTVITNMIQLVVALLNILLAIAYFKMPTKYPEAWSNSRLNISNGLYYFICALSTLFWVTTLIKSMFSLSHQLVITNIVAAIILGAIGIWRSKTGDIGIRTSVWP